MLRPLLITLALSASLAAGAPVAAAPPRHVPAPALYAGVFGGAHLVLGDWDIHQYSDAGVDAQHAPLVEVRVGFQFLRWLAFEAGATAIPFGANAPALGDLAGGDLSAVALHWTGDVLFSPFDGAWSPHVSIGAGGYQLVSGQLGADTDWDAHAGLGLRWMALDWLAVRADVHVGLTDSYSAGLAPLLDAALGVDFFVWRGGSDAPPDADSDGIPDDEDACRKRRGVLSAQGCPDADGDGIADGDDQCVQQPGPARFRGCPDSDGDGISDEVDRCPSQAGDEAHQGCAPPPDRDKDGFADGLDACPDEAGAGTLDGCPDADHDGIHDADDKCPQQAGTQKEQGCLPKAIQKKFSGTVSGINFETASAVIRPQSYNLLAEAVRVFKDYPSLHIEISGHTDDDGDDEANMRLSQARADAVLAFLVDKGIGKDRLRALGYGETRPVAPNKSLSGKAKNRRIEFKIVGSY